MKLESRGLIDKKSKELEEALKELHMEMGFNNSEKTEEKVKRDDDIKLKDVVIEDSNIEPKIEKLEDTEKIAQQIMDKIKSGQPKKYK